MTSLLQLSMAGVCGALAEKKTMLTRKYRVRSRSRAVLAFTLLEADPLILAGLSSGLCHLHQHLICYPACSMWSWLCGC